MTFNVDKFNQGTAYDARANLGTLKFLSLEKRPVFKDGKRTDEMEVTHAIVFSEKIGDNLQLKLAPGKTYEEPPFMTVIQIIGAASPFIYNFPNAVGFGDNRQEITDFGFSLRVDGYECLGSMKQPPKEEKAG